MGNTKLDPIKYFLSGGFAYGDEQVQVMPTQVKSKNHLWEEVKKFIQKTNSSSYL